MAVAPFNLVHFPEATIPKPAALDTFTPDNVPSLQELQSIKREITEYKELQEQRMKHSDAQLKVVNDQYIIMKARDGLDGNKPKQLKKEPPDSLGSPQRVAKPPVPAVRVSGPTAMTSSAQPSIPAATPTLKATARAGSAALKLEPTSSKPNKKKRKRPDELEELLNDGSTRTTPTTKGHGHKEHKSKKAKHDDHDLRMNPFGFRKVSDWSDSIKGGLPPKPPRNPLPVPQTDDPEQVNDDFAERKQPPNQVTAHAYWNYIEPWTRQIKEEDVAFLAFSNEDEELWEMPPLGRHYSEVWEDEDRFALGLQTLNRPAGSRIHNPYAAFTDPPPPSAGGANAPPANTGLRWDPATLTEADAITEEHGSGPLTERIFSSFMHLPSGSKMDEDDSYKGGPGLGRAAGQGTVGDLEERLMKECKAMGLIRDGEEPDYSQPQDDQIASELRRCQRALKAQMQINEGRKKRLLAISELRLSYADYEDVKEGMERSVSNMFSKLGSVGAPKVTKKKKKEKEKVAAAAAVNPATGEPAGISGLGLVGMDGNLQIPPEIYEPVTVLRRWKGMVGSRFEEIERESPGLVWGLPKKSIYEGLEEEIAETQKTTASSFAAGSSTVPGSSNSVNESRSGTSGGSANDTAMAVDERQSSPEDVVMQTT